MNAFISWKRQTVIAALLVTLATAMEASIAGGAEALVPAAAPNPRALTGVLAHVPGGNTVGGEIREATPRADGYFHLDTPRMIARLKALHANTFNYLIWNSRSDWDDLQKEFLPAAQEAGIATWVYLVPPTESVAKYSHPFKTDYRKWATALAELSARYPSLQAWVMDDFTVNLKNFTPAFLMELRGLTRAINPNFRFFPVLQLTAINEKWLADYGPVIDGIVAPYIDLPYNDVQRTTSLRPQIDAAHGALKSSGLPLYLLLYAGRHLNSPLEPTEDYVAQSLQIALDATGAGYLSGVVCYGTFLDEKPPRTAYSRALDGAGRLSLARSPSRTIAGEWASASQTITIDPASPRQWLSFWHHDRWGPGDDKGMLVKEILVDDKTVWQGEPAHDSCDTWLDGGPLEGPLDLTEILRGKKTATLTIRLRTLQTFGNKPIDVSFDRLSATGFKLEDPGFESTTKWKIADSGGALLAAIDRYDEARPQKVFDAVRKAYGGYKGK